jgi:hypothetical protein
MGLLLKKKPFIRAYSGFRSVVRRPTANLKNTINSVYMKPRITVLTIGVDDLEKSMKFYQDGLGLQTEGILGNEFEYGAVVFFDLQSGLRLGLWPRKSIAHDTKLPLGKSSPTEFTLGHKATPEK